MSYRKITKYFQNIKLYGIIGAAVIMAMSVTACSTVKNSGTEISAAQTSAGLADGATVNGIYSYDDMFTERDLDVGYDESSAVKINLADDSTTVTVGDDTETDASKADETKADDSETDETKADESETNETENAASGVYISGNIITITKEGTYVLSGALSEGQIVVDADSAKVQLVLDNADITCASSAAIYVKNADKAFITLAEGSENILMNTAEYEAIDDNNIDAVIFSKDDLTLNGKGTLTINSEYGHGIVSKDDLKLVGGTYNITAENHAISGKDSVRIADGTYNLTSGKDGIHSENADDDEKGFVYIASGDFTIESTGDGIDASYVVQIDEGDFDITAGDGAENATKTHNDIPGGGTRDNMGGGASGGAAQDGEAPSGDKPSGDGSDKSDSGSASGKQTGQTPPDRLDGDSFDGSRPDEKTSDNTGGQTAQTPPDKPGTDTSDGQKSDKNSQSKDIADNTTASSASSDTGSESSSSTSPDADSENNSSTSSDADSTSTKGIKSDGALYVNGGTFTINSADDSFHSNSDATINDGTYTISSGDDGIHADSALLVNGGTITVTESYEGLEGLNITINDGKIDITASDDGMNAAGGNDASGFGGRGGDGFKGMQTPDSARKSNDTSDNTQKSDNTSVASQDTDAASDDEMWMVINGGYVHVLAGGDGLDSNGDLTINGGEVYVDGPSDNGNSAIDYGEKSSFNINGGTVVAVGSSGMAEDVSSDSKQQVAFVKLDSQADAGDVILKDADGNEIISYTVQKKYDCVIISTADLKAGQTYTLSASGNESEVSL
ncbi:carbohydrate-binding domain-containing protein [Agathobacter rectalis]|uniref:carbohydrate-binding domain-containing protein n=1 Tax=Agathobacter rectalis TaxID=39491 RepID=UPI0027D33B05|nr:carbohydrate-binding domain-containing protein [Agathobacter rectalis]MCQ4816088.1 carbohydrate-binding domain-containing protein [Agathobacter rectalis]